MEIIGNQLKDIMKSRKMTCDTLAKELKHNGRPYSRNAINRKCNGVKDKKGEEGEEGKKRFENISEKTINEMAQILSIEPDVLTDVAAYDEYKKAKDECEEIAESFELDDGAITFIKLACDYIEGKDKGNRFGYVCRLLEDEKLFKELESDAPIWRKRIDEIDAMLKKKTINLGTGAYLCLEPEKGVFYTRWSIIINEDIQRLFFMENHRIPSYRTDWIKGKIINHKELQTAIMEHLKNYDTGSEFLNEKLKMLMEGQGVNYTMTPCNAEPQFTEEQMEEMLDNLRRYIKETEGSLAE